MNWNVWSERIFQGLMVLYIIVLVLFVTGLITSLKMVVFYD